MVSPLLQFNHVAMGIFCFTLSPSTMPQFKISGVWKDANNVITHYAIHSVTQTGGITRAVKTSKAQAIALLEIVGNSATTWDWNYTTSRFVDGEAVQVVQILSGKYLRSNRDNTLTDNLGHLINFDWIQP